MGTYNYLLFKMPKLPNPLTQMQQGF